MKLGSGPRRKLTLDGKNDVNLNPWNALGGQQRAGRRMGRMAAVVLWGALGAGLCYAQGFPGGGMGGGPGGPGGPGGGGHGDVDKKEPASRPVLDDMLPPDPWLLWLESLGPLREQLRLDPKALALFDAFTRELKDAQQFNARRVERAVHYRPVVTSQIIDPGRDLHDESDDAKDWVGTLDDLSKSWDALKGALTPEQLAQVQRAYGDALERSRKAAAAKN
jgi:hypothetical protein